MLRNAGELGEEIHTHKTFGLIPHDCVIIYSMYLQDSKVCMYNFGILE